MNLSQPKHISIYSAKGGVGKSSVAFNIALNLAKKHKVILFDADLYGSSLPGICHRELNIKPEFDNGFITLNDNLSLTAVGAYIDMHSPVVLRAPMVNKIINHMLNSIKTSQKADVDYVIYDLPPGTGDIQLTLMQNINFTGTIVVSTAEASALEITKKSVALLEKLNVPILGFINNMAFIQCDINDSHTHPLYDKKHLQNFLAQTKLSLLQTLPFTSLQNLPEHFNEFNTNLAKELKNAHKITYQYTYSTNALTIYSDKKKQTIPVNELRKSCKCAICKNQSISPSSNLKIINVTSVGSYGVKIFFSDGHNSGIFSLADYLDN